MVHGFQEGLHSVHEKAYTVYGRGPRDSRYATCCTPLLKEEISSPMVHQIIQSLANQHTLSNAKTDNPLQIKAV